MLAKRAVVFESILARTSSVLLLCAPSAYESVIRSFMQADDELEVRMELRPTAADFQSSQAVSPSRKGESLVNSAANKRMSKSKSVKEHFWPAGPASLTVQVPESIVANKPTTSNRPRYSRPTRPPRWRSREFLLYATILAIGTWRMIVVLLRLSSGMADKSDISRRHTS